MPNYPSQKIVTVCNKCLTETCLKGQFPCAERVAGEADSLTDTEGNIFRLMPSTREAVAAGEPMFEAEAPAKNGIEAIGPFEEYRIVVDGYRVPNLTGRLIDGMWHFTLDNRFGCDVPERFGHGIAWMIATAQAIGAGYSCFGKNSQIANPFKCRLIGIGRVITEDAADHVDSTRAN